MKSVYIETTIPSYYFETRSTALVIAWGNATRAWWDRHRRDYRLSTSRFVLEELTRTPGKKGKLALELIKEVEILDEPPEIRPVAEYYIEQQLMPVGVGGDAYHLAMTSIHSIDFLLTWNCSHLANANKITHLTVLNRRLGLHVPVVTTPFSLNPEILP